MFPLEKDKVEAYAKFFRLNVSKMRLVWSNYMIYCMVSIPAAFAGIYSEFTKIFLLPLVIIFGVWALALSYKLSEKHRQFVLFHGVMGLFISFSFLLAAVKFMASIKHISVIDLIIIFSLYLIGIIVVFLNKIRLIDKGSYLNGTDKPQIGLSAIFFFGIATIIVSLIRGHLNQHQVVVVLILIMLFLSVFTMANSHNILKYFFIKKYLMNENN